MSELAVPSRLCLCTFPSSRLIAESVPKHCLQLQYILELHKLFILLASLTHLFCFGIGSALLSPRASYTTSPKTKDI